MRRLAPALAVLLAALAAGCATPGRSPLEGAVEAAGAPGAPAATLAAAGFHDWLHRGDPRAAGARFASATAADPADPWARLGSALLAQRGLDDGAEAESLLALLANAPGHPLAPLAARRLGELAELSPALGSKVEAGLAPVLASGKLRGVAALRVRGALAAAAEARGDTGAAARFRAENGTVGAWTLAGPWGAYHALEIDRAFPPEQGALPARFEGPPNVGVLEARILPVTAGVASLDGEPPNADIWYLAADVRLARGGDYLVSVGASATARLALDGEPLAERRAYASFLPGAVVVPRSLGAGVHRLLVKVGRGAGRASLAVSFARADGAPSDAESSAPAPGGEPSAAMRPGSPPPVAWSARELAASLEGEAGPALARWLAARDRLDSDREEAKALLEQGLSFLPNAAPLRAALGDALRDDPTLADRVGRARAEALYREALARDPGDAATRLRRAELMRLGDRLDDAQAALDDLAPPEARRPQALLARARLAAVRGFPEGAERLAEEAWQRGSLCPALEMLYDLVSRRDAVAREDEVAQALVSCPGGRERLAEHRRLRGNAAGAVALLEPLARAWPARIETRLALARALTARGEPAAAAAALADLARLWPRDARIQRRRADALELAGDRSGAGAARRAALALDGADLKLRRALALENGTEVLEAEAEDGAATIRGYEAAAPRTSTSSALVLDALALEAYPDGAYTERVHQVVAVADQRGVERWGEVSVPHGAEILRLRALKRDGRILEPEEAGGDKPSVSLTGLEPGDYVEFEYLRARPSRGATIPGFTADAFFFRVESEPLWRSSYVALAPRGSGLAGDAHHLEPPPVKVEGDREVVRLLRTAVPALVPEPGAPGIAEYLPFLLVGAGAGREALQLAVADGFLERVRPSREVAALAQDVMRPPGAAPLAGEELLRALYERVNRSVEGQGGSLSDSAGAVLSRGRGSRLILLKALCSAAGLRARVALARGFETDPAAYRFPRAELYAYPVLRVEIDGRTHWLDPSTRWTPFGVLPGNLRGVEALVLPEPGDAPEVARTPEAGPPEGREIDLRVAVGPGGDAVIEAVESYLGFDGAAAKSALERLDAASRRQAVEQSLSRSFRDLTLESLAVEGEQQLGTPLVLRWRARVRQLVRVVGGKAALETPLFPVRLGSRFLARGVRETPLLVATDERQVLRMEMALPPGAEPAPAGARDVESPFGGLRRSEQVRGATLVREDRFVLRRGRVQPAGYDAFARFARSVDELQGQPLRLGRWP
jgi:hypothetical protein